MRYTRTRLIVLASLVVLIVVSGCSPPRENTAEDKTIYKLNLLGLAAQRFSPDEIIQFRTSSDFISAATGRGYLDEAFPSYYLNDGWGNPLQWEVLREGHSVVVQITSCGPNGIRNKDEGDDLSVRIEYDEKGKVEMAFQKKGGRD